MKFQTQYDIGQDLTQTPKKKWVKYTDNKFFIKFDINKNYEFWNFKTKVTTIWYV